MLGPVQSPLKRFCPLYRSFGILLYPDQELLHGIFGPVVLGANGEQKLARHVGEARHRVPELPTNEPEWPGREFEFFYLGQRGVISDIEKVDRIVLWLFIIRIYSRYTIRVGGESSLRLFQSSASARDLIIEIGTLYKLPHLRSYKI